MTPEKLRTGYRTARIALVIVVVLLLGAMSLNPAYNFWK